MGDQRRNCWPLDTRPRQVLGFEIVGMKLDEPGQQIVAAEILAARRRRDIANDRIADHHRTARHAVGQHDPRIGENRFGLHVISRRFNLTANSEPL